MLQVWVVVKVVAINLKYGSNLIQITYNNFDFIFNAGCIETAIDIVVFIM